MFVLGLPGDQRLEEGNWAFITRESSRNILLLICVFVRQCVRVLYMNYTHIWVGRSGTKQMFWTTWFSCLQTAHTPLIYHAQQKHFACKFLCFSCLLLLTSNFIWEWFNQTFYVVSPGVEREWPPTHEKFSDASHSGGVLGWGGGQQQEVVQEACCSVHPARPEEATFHPHCGETQDALQETYQDHPKGTKSDLVFIHPLLLRV